MPATNCNLLIVTCFNIGNSSSEQKYIEKLNKIDFLKIYRIWILHGIKTNILDIAEVSKIDTTYQKDTQKQVQSLTAYNCFTEF